jgi:YVTN family beta-propeller protein
MLMKLSKSFVVAAAGMAVSAGIASAQPYIYVGLNYEAQVAVVDLATNSVVGYLPTHANTGSIMFEAGTNYVYAVGGGSVTKLDRVSGTEVQWVGFGTSIGQGVMHPAGGTMFVGFGTDACVRGFSTADFGLINTGGMPNNTVYMDITSDGNYIYASSANFGGGDKTISVMDTNTYSVVTPIYLDGMAGAVQLSPDNTKLYVGYEFDAVFNPGDKIEVYDTATDSLETTIYVPAGGVTDVAFSADGTRAYAFHPYINKVSVIDVATSTVLTSWDIAGLPWGGSVSPDGTMVFVATFFGDTVEVMNASTGAVMASIPVGQGNGGPVCVEFGPELINVCAADFDGTGFVDTDDFDAFVGAFEAGDESADFDGTGFVDTDDFDAFVRAFEAGC